MRVISERTVKSRKQHPCVWCVEQIDAGTAAVRQTNKDNGEIYSIYFHPECRDAISLVPGWIEPEELPQGQFARGSTVDCFGSDWAE